MYLEHSPVVLLPIDSEVKPRFHWENGIPVATTANYREYRWMNYM